MRLPEVAVLLGLGVAALACGRVPLDFAPTGAAGAGSGSPGTAGTSGSSGRAPPKHRPAAETCSPFHPSAAAVCPLRPSAQAACSTDADCAAAKDGHCVGPLPKIGCQCTYDECSSDADCAAQQVCACSGPFIGNQCVRGDCHVDADCGAGGYCTPVPDPCSGVTDMYACHRTGDECFTDADCPQRACLFDFTLRRWACEPVTGCPL